MMDYKDTQAAISTVTYDKNEIEAPTENIYEAISIIAKRATQINACYRILELLYQKLQRLLLMNFSYH